jgi:hypothetical protein
MKSEEWKSYRTRFLVNAKQLNSTLSFVDHLGRQHRGRKGDYLVESSDGVVSIAPRRIFEDIYVPIAVQHESGRAETPLRETRVPETRVPQAMTCTSGDPNLDLRRFESLQIEEIMRSKPPIGRQRIDETPTVRHHPDAPVHRKLPQPCWDRRSSPNRIELM